MKSAGEAAEIPEAYDLTGSLRAASELAGCSPNTVARYLRLRARGRALDEPACRSQVVDPYLAKVEEWVERSHGRSELVVVDDIGLPPAGADGAEALCRLVDAASEKRSLILTSNLHPARFDTIFPKGLATAAVYRLLNHAHVIVTEGRSHRLAEAIEGRGVAPLDAANVPPIMADDAL